MLTQEATWEEREYDQLVREVVRLEADSASRQSRDQRVLHAYEIRLANCQDSLANFDFMAQHGDFGAESSRYRELSSGLKTRANQLMRELRQQEHSKA